MQHVLQMDSAGDGADIVGTLTANVEAATVVYMCVCVCVCVFLNILYVILFFTGCVCEIRFFMFICPTLQT